ncbi:ABC transporter ATP-binding protein [Thermosediminibacter oceani]|uniref:ABC-type quaternary amine transporter n=1 Tax=Thermosediminibacter oceani (strain ATCC BAA-1034 / DSM 16646 / JW/IW-1228P) TaxID=555079 RepID=D9RZI7_THEOJ|nr:ABC transporter ATP-binding protein [Thermosediminibacter oceani]ADL06885.1 ABC transporter related protein [Thermosediminibacter oceani DSM 16646]
MAEIRVENVSKAFGGEKIIKDISFEVAGGQLLSLLGPSGAGKTTLLKIIAGLLKPDAGEIYFDGVPVVKVPVEKRGAVLVFQDYLLFPHMTVEQNVAFGLRMAGVPRYKRARIVAEMLALVDMKGYEHKYPHELSGGQKQRVALARALAVKPRVLLLDEPFSNLDPRLRESMREFTRDLQRRMEMTTILVTHDWEEAFMMSDRIAVLIDGSIKQVGTPEEVYFRPASLEVAEFLGDKKNYVKGMVKNGVFFCPLGNLPAPQAADGDYTAVIRPEHVRISPGGERAGWTICDTRFAGGCVYYRVFREGLSLLCAADNTVIYRPGEKVDVSVDFSKAILFRTGFD